MDLSWTEGSKWTPIPIGFNMAGLLKDKKSGSLKKYNHFNHIQHYELGK